MRLVIHTGFKKCGSSAIQHALAEKQSELIEQSIFLFGKDLLLNLTPPPADVPFWTAANSFVDPAARSGVPARLRQELSRLCERDPNATAVLSAEVLGAPGPAPLFKGIDEIADTIVVFYVRPQFEWIPSAWKQWELKSGVPLDAYVNDCLAQNMPHFLPSIQAWVTALPRARIVGADSPAGGRGAWQSGAGFLQFFSASLEADGKAMTGRINPSFDYALLNILNKNPWLFRGRQDNEPFKALMRILPEQSPRHEHQDAPARG